MFPSQIQLNNLYYREKLIASKYDNELKEQVQAILNYAGKEVGCKINKWSYVVQSQRSAICPLGWQHVYIDKGISCGLR